jgi:hypothetical protein
VTGSIFLIAFPSQLDDPCWTADESFSLKMPVEHRFAPDGETDSVFWLRFYNKTTRAAVQV